MQKNRLFDLIKSLDKNEKGYLKKHLFNKADPENNYFIKLFEHIQEQTIYDEQTIKLKINDKSMLHHFSSHKTYLYEAIMKMLITYQSQNSIKNQIKTLIRSAEILFLRGLHEDGNYTLLKALTLAKKNDFFTFMLEIHDLFHKNNITFMDYNRLKSVERNQLQLLNTFDKYSNILDYRSAQIDCLKIIRNKASDNKQQKLLTLAQSAPLNNPKNALSRSAQITHHNYNGMIYLELNKPEIALQFFKKLIAINEKFPSAHSQEYVNNAIVILGNSMLTANMVKNKPVFNTAFAKMNQLFEKQKKFQFLIAKLIIKNKLFYFIRHSEYKEGLFYIKSIEKKLNTRLPSYDPIRHFIYNEIAIIYFMNKDYKKSSFYLKETLLNKNVRSVDPEISCFAYTLWLLSEYLTGDSDYVEHLLRSIERKIKSMRYDTFIARQCIHFVKTVNHQTDLALIKKAYKLLSQEVKEYPHFNFTESYIFSIADWALIKVKEV